MRNRDYWTDEAEIEYLHSIGKHADNADFSQQQLLRGYIRGAERRTEWGNMNKHRIITKAKILLANLT